MLSSHLHVILTLSKTTSPAKLCQSDHTLPHTNHVVYLPVPPDNRIWKGRTLLQSNIPISESVIIFNQLIADSMTRVVSKYVCE